MRRHQDLYLFGVKGPLALLAPFPLYDLATLLESKGYHFDSNTKELSGLNLESHDAMNDVKMMAEVWSKSFN